MILGFKESIAGKKTYFVARILTGDKKFTLRDDPHDKWVPGRKIEMATGIRTKHYRQFNTNRPDLQVCTGTQTAVISPGEILIDGDRLPIKQHYSIARLDGFNTVQEFFDFHLGAGTKDPKSQVRKKVIHWTDYRITPWGMKKKETVEVKQKELF